MANWRSHGHGQFEDAAAMTLSSGIPPQAPKVWLEKQLRDYADPTALSFWAESGYEGGWPWGPATEVQKEALMLELDPTRDRRPLAPVNASTMKKPGALRPGLKRIRFLS